MTPKSESEMWIEEYTHALDAFNIALMRLKVAIDKVRVENNNLHSELSTYQQLWKSAEAVIKTYGMEKDDPD